jgi:hypothetical protein
VGGGNVLNTLKFKPHAAIGRDNADAKKRYAEALRRAGLIA